MRIIKSLLVTTSIAGMSLAAFATASQAEPVTLKMAHWLPPLNHMSFTAKNWAQSVEAASGGSLKIVLDKSALAKPPGQYDLSKNGIRDISWGVAGYTPGLMQLYRMAEVPFATPDAETGSPGLVSWYMKHGFQNIEFKGTHFLTGWVHGPGLLHSKKKITTLEDLKGVKIRVGGGGVLIAKSLGAVPVAMSAPKAHESLQRGTTDAAFFPWEAVKGFKLVKLAKHHLVIPGGLYTTSFWLTMNKKKFAGLPAKARNALSAMGGVTGARVIGRRWDDADKAGKELAIKNGNTITPISGSENKRWAKAVQIIKDNWIAKANKMGQNGKALMEELLAMMKG